MGEFAAVGGVWSEHRDAGPGVPQQDAGDTLAVADGQKRNRRVVSDAGFYFWYAISVIGSVGGGYSS